MHICNLYYLSYMKLIFINIKILITLNNVNLKIFNILNIIFKYHSQQFKKIKRILIKFIKYFINYYLNYLFISLSYFFTIFKKLET